MKYRLYNLNRAEYITDCDSMSDLELYVRAEFIDEFQKNMEFEHTPLPYGYTVITATVPASNGMRQVIGHYMY